jgi:hypothetical protein
LPLYRPTTGKARKKYQTVYPCESP